MFNTIQSKRVHISNAMDVIRIKKYYLMLTETKPRDVVAAKPQHEEDPYFHYPLNNQTNFRGNIVWA